ncbi:hypothetical protein [Chitinophaga nivalis]|uniref:DUF4382 domain-containing protein n=1 Tax=Chitinophaga nivalis TaxID=2991709 RepID=A0ABT3IL87_9BACT|nr:hypothetical protein [Chitinophaga nivalis]MCW3465585.1 hypothetical protein [Chitinophaga nivalis]MCW3484724.1 hypothetical protein [Chitinophaga nivalis]
MKRTITGTLALATLVVGMSAFKSADATTVKSVDSIATSVNNFKSIDSVMHADSLGSVDSLVRVDSLVSLDSLQGKGMNTLLALDSLSGADSVSHLNVVRSVDSVQSVDSIRAVEGGSITGKITPAEGATEIEADNGTEKLKAAVSQGSFAIPAAKSGTYTITILGKAPFKNAVIKDVKVEDGKATDLGEIKLEQ